MIELLVKCCREVLRSGEVDRAELYAKRSRTRTVRHEADGGRHELRSTEEGWALRFGDRRRSGFLGGTGLPDASLVEWLPEPDGRGLDIPEAPGAGSLESGAVDSHVDQPLFGPAEGASILDTVRTVLSQEMPSARLSRAVLEEGVAEHLIVADDANGTGPTADATPQFAARWRTRAAALLVEARLGEHGTRCYQPLSSSRAARPQALARRLADRLFLMAEAQPAQRDRCEVLLSADLGAALLAISWPAWAVGSIVDEDFEVDFDLGIDPTLAGPLRTSRDGLGRLVRRVPLIERGRWSNAPGGVDTWLRPSWRLPPSKGPGQLILRSELGRTVGSLLASMTRGIYLVEGRISGAGGQIRLVGRGFEVRQGQARRPVGPLGLSLPVGSWLASVSAFGRDFDWAAGRGGVFAAPSVLLRRAEIEPVVTDSL